MTQPAYPCSLLCPASRRWLRHQRTTRVRPAEGMGKYSIEIVDKIQQFIETIATLPGDLGLIPIAEALKSATSRTGGKPNVIARGPEPCSPGISRARSRIGPGSLAPVSNHRQNST